MTVKASTLLSAIPIIPIGVLKPLTTELRVSTEIAGNQLHEPVRKFKEVLNSNPDAFDKYRPSDDCGEFNEFFLSSQN